MYTFSCACFIEVDMDIIVAMHVEILHTLVLTASLHNVQMAHGRSIPYKRKHVPFKIVIIYQVKELLTVFISHPNFEIDTQQKDVIYEMFESVIQSQKTLLLFVTWPQHIAVNRLILQIGRTSVNASDLLITWEIFHRVLQMTSRCKNGYRFAKVGQSVNIIT